MVEYPGHPAERTIPRNQVRLGYIRRENKNAKRNTNVSVATEIIFGLGGFHFLGAKIMIVPLAVLLLVQFSSPQVA